MILRLGMILSVVYSKKENIIFYEKNVKLTQNITFNNFCFQQNFSLLSLLTNLKKKLDIYIS